MAGWEGQSGRSAEVTAATRPVWVHSMFKCGFCSVIKVLVYEFVFNCLTSVLQQGAVNQTCVCVCVYVVISATFWDSNAVIV